jgi:putative N-acetylmannosamine-6-phosphate epimerase
MIEKGIIVSIQGFSQSTTQELANRSIEGGAVAIRTDQPIIIDNPVIGLEKLEDMKYYITSTRDSLINVQKWADYIAIDSRKGNQNIDLLYSHCHVNGSKIIADIQNIADVENILDICNNQKIREPVYLATTFSFLDSGSHDNHLIEQIQSICDIPIIAEGKCNNKNTILSVKQNGVNNICIGTYISNIKQLTKYYSDLFMDLIAND